MKLFASVGLFFFLVCSFHVGNAGSLLTRKSEEEQLKRSFEEFIVKHERAYADEEEYWKRFDIFRENVEKVKRMNEKERGTATYGVTKFSDMTEEEFDAFFGYRQPEEFATGTRNVRIPDDVHDQPENWDWRDKNVVTPVRNEGDCGCCWAFSTVSILESAWAIKTGELLSLSVQQLLDCDTTDHGCDGGFPITALKELSVMGGLETDKDYPYVADERICKLNKTAVRVPVAGGDLLPSNETSMAVYLWKNGPISVSINVRGLRFYMSGISHPTAEDCPGTDMNHAMALVGYGVERSNNSDADVPFWILKNSWGTYFGEDGYFRLYRGDNSCNITAMPIAAQTGD